MAIKIVSSLDGVNIPPTLFFGKLGIGETLAERLHRVGLALSRSATRLVIIFDELGEVVPRRREVLCAVVDAVADAVIDVVLGVGVVRGLHDSPVDDELELSAADSAALLRDVDGLGVTPNLETK